MRALEKGMSNAATTKIETYTTQGHLARRTCKVSLNATYRGPQVESACGGCPEWRGEPGDLIAMLETDPCKW